MPALSKNEPITTVRPASGPTDRSMPPGQDHAFLAECDERERGDQDGERARLKVDRNLALWAWV